MFVGCIKLYLIDTCQLRANASRGTSELNHTERERMRETDLGAERFLKLEKVQWVRGGEAKRFLNKCRGA